MKIGNQEDAEGYLRSAAYKLLNTEDGFIVADKAGVGGDRDTWLVWLPSQMFAGRSFSQFETRLIDRIEAETARYPDARYTILVDSLEGISRSFSDFASARGLKIRVPVQFFDAPFRLEESPETASAIKSLRDVSALAKRVPQPYSQDRHGDSAIAGADLLTVLRKMLQSGSDAPCIHFIIGSAGAGKSVLFQSLFALLYRDFIDQKNRLKFSPRPVPLIPEHLRETYTVRTLALVESFLRSDVASPVSRDTLEWMLVNSCCLWMFDGLDELYSGDPEFFAYILELLTRPNSRAQIVVCARDSLLSSNDEFMQFIRSFAPDVDSAVKIYRLSDWDISAKRHFASVELMGRPPKAREADSPPVAAFLAAINTPPIVRQLSGLPYYCSLFLERFKEGHSLAVNDEFELLADVVEALKKREILKGTIIPDAFEKNGLDDVIETIATDYCVSNYLGTSTDDIRVYAATALRASLTEEDKQKLVTSLVQFPLFASADRPGIISFKHELLAEYLFGKQTTRSVQTDPIGSLSKLAGRPLLTDTLAFRYVASHITGNNDVRAAILKELIVNTPQDRELKALLQFWISSASGMERMPEGRIFEGRDLSGVEFSRIDLTNASFRNANLTDVSFVECRLFGVKFEGCHLVGTRFIKLDDDALNGARFGNLEHFDYIYAGTKLIEDRGVMKEWLAKETGFVEAHSDPCSTALQLRGLFKKFVHDDGSGRRDQLRAEALLRGTLYSNAPAPKDCIESCIKHGFLAAPNFRGYIRRASGEKYNEVVNFMKDWKMHGSLRELMDELCPVKNCPHVPM